MTVWITPLMRRKVIQMTWEPDFNTRLAEALAIQKQTEKPQPLEIARRLIEDDHLTVKQLRRVAVLLLAYCESDEE